MKHIAYDADQRMPISNFNSINQWSASATERLSGRCAMPNEYILVATKPDNSKVFWTWTGFSASEDRAARIVSLDFADTTFQIEREAHPNWKFDLRIYEAKPNYIPKPSYSSNFEHTRRYKQSLGAQIGVIEQIPNKPCLECGREIPVTLEQYNRTLWFPLCHECRVKAARR